MKTELKDVIHLYLGCDIINKDETLPVKFIGYTQSEIFPPYISKMLAIAKSNDTFIEFYAEDIKPILRQMSAKDIEYLITEFGLGGFEIANNYYSPSSLLWIFKEQIDIFELIHSGQAIDKITLKNNQ